MRGGSSSAALAVAALLTATALGSSNPSSVGPGLKLTGAGEVHRGEFGWSVALSRDGHTAAVGAPNDDSPTFDSANGVLSQGKGAVWVFVSAGPGWRQLGPKIVSRNGVGPAQFGADVAVSADGRTLVVGAPADSGGAGALAIFTRKGGGWQPYRRKLSGGAATGFGTSVAVSDSGRVALIGGAAARSGAGAAWIYTWRGSTWKQTARLIPPDERGLGQFGRDVALSADGSVALVGAPGDDGGSGAAWLFVRHGDRWLPLPRKLKGGDADGRAGFGRSVALSASGATALVGGPIDGNGVGAAWLFHVASASWSQTEKLKATDETGPGQFGDSVALSADGTRGLVGGALDDFGRGAAWSFGSGSLQTLRPPNLRPSSEFGDSVALSGAGTVALVGSAGDADFVGAAWVFG